MHIFAGINDLTGQANKAHLFVYLSIIDFSTNQIIHLLNANETKQNETSPTRPVLSILV